MVVSTVAEAEAIRREVLDLEPHVRALDSAVPGQWAVRRLYGYVDWRSQDTVEPETRWPVTEQAATDRRLLSVLDQSRRGVSVEEVRRTHQALLRATTAGSGSGYSVDLRRRDLQTHRREIRIRYLRLTGMRRFDLVRSRAVFIGEPIAKRVRGTGRSPPRSRPRRRGRSRYSATASCATGGIVAHLVTRDRHFVLVGSGVEMKTGSSSACQNCAHLSGRVRIGDDAHDHEFLDAGTPVTPSVSR